ncbi:DNA-binding protein [Pseudoalteromonas spongiae]|uniref:DNA-binding protein n=1 Tax=Pseudoalteromonas spongiae TaxID=298657 RepID=UPI00110BA51C|nr:DNA-binding protein [Pseudoalteromonas spongiae]TMO83095.1 hypothetical protein CWC15_16690 [Pseudoalteromonas spongiae]
MGRVAEYSQNEIINAGEQIESNGKHVNPFAIREKLGGGSPDRIKKIWESHIASRQFHDAEQNNEDVIELPTEIQEAFVKNLKTVSSQLERIAQDSFRVAMQLAEKRVKSTIDEYQTKISEFEQSEQEAFHALETSDREKDGLEQKVEILTIKNEQLLAENSKLQGNIESLQLRMSQLETKESELSELQREFGKLQGRIEIMENNTRLK